MMIVLLLLSACVCLGLADDIYVEKQYGKTYKWMLHGDTRSLEFTPKDKSEVTVLWKRHVKKGIDPHFAPIDKPLKGIVDLHFGVICCYYELRYLTQEDSGHYRMRDKDRKLLRTVTIEVIANTRSYELSPGESLDFTFDLKPNSCNIYFIPESDLNLKGFETEIVRQGRLQWKGLDKVNCAGFQLSRPCGILIENLQSSCGGRFEVRDQNGNKVLVASLKMKPLQSPDVGFGVFVFSLVVIFCSFGCLCCCGKRSSKEDDSETEAAAASAPEDEPVGPRSDELSQPSRTHYPAQPSYTPTGPLVHDPTDHVPPSYSEYEPVGPRSDELSQPSRTHYPALPSYTPTGPLVHDPTDYVPPSYTEVVASAEQAVPPSVPIYSDDEPQFEIRGMTFPSDSASVYTSDKLNFL